MADFKQILSIEAATADQLSLGGTWAADAEQTIDYDNSSLLLPEAFAELDIEFSSWTMVLDTRVVDMYVIPGMASGRFEEYDSTTLPQAKWFVDSFRLTENHAAGTNVKLFSRPFETVSDYMRVVLTNVSGQTIASGTTFALRAFTRLQDEQ